MRPLFLAATLVLASASAQAQTIDVGSILSANGFSIGNGGGQPQAVGQTQGASAPAGMAQGAGNEGGQNAAGQGRSQRQAGRAKQAHESAAETRARNIAARYGISW